MITTILWDVDGTLLNFEAAEKAAIRALFQEFGFGVCTDEMLKRYSQINKIYWERLERKEVTRQEVLEGRFLISLRKKDWMFPLRRNLMNATRQVLEIRSFSMMTAMKL